MPLHSYFYKVQFSQISWHLINTRKNSSIILFLTGTNTTWLLEGDVKQLDFRSAINVQATRGQNNKRHFTEDTYLYSLMKHLVSLSQISVTFYCTYTIYLLFQWWKLKSLNNYTIWFCLQKSHGVRHGNKRPAVEAGGVTPVAEKHEEAQHIRSSSTVSILVTFTISENQFHQISFFFTFWTWIKFKDIYTLNKKGWTKNLIWFLLLSTT